MLPPEHRLRGRQEDVKREVRSDAERGPKRTYTSIVYARLPMMPGNISKLILHSLLVAGDRNGLRSEVL